MIAERWKQNQSRTLCIVACGTLGQSILQGIVQKAHTSTETLDTDDITTSSPRNGECKQTTHKSVNNITKVVACVRTDDTARKIRSNPLFKEVDVYVKNNVEAVRHSDIVLLACKPQKVFEIVTELKENQVLDDKVLISVCAGITLSQIGMIDSANASCHIRVMPNTPSQIMQGMSVICRPEDWPWFNRVSQQIITSILDITIWIFSKIGRVLVLPEKNFDAATAICGSGPAFVSVMLESMIDGGIQMGLPRHEAQILAAQTMQGAARLALVGLDPYQIRSAVTTPGGCTIGGLLVLEDGKMRSTIARAIETSTHIASGLGSGHKS